MEQINIIIYYHHKNSKYSTCEKNIWEFLETAQFKQNFLTHLYSINTVLLDLKRVY